MDLRSELPFWTLKNGLLHAYPALSGNVSCDIAIVGGGITGALLAYYLIEAGVDCVIIDRREFGFGSTSASTGLMIYENDVDLRLLAGQVGEDVAVRTFELCRLAVEKLEAISKEIRGGASFARRKSLYVTGKKKDVPNLKQEYELRLKHSFQGKYIERDELAGDYSITGEAAILSRGAAQMDPYRYCLQLLSFCTAKGLRAYDRTAMTKYQHRGRSVVISTNRRYTITAKKLVVATGYEAQSLLKQKVVSLKSTYAMVSEPLAGDLGALERHLFWNTDRPYLYARSTVDKRIIVGGEDDAVLDPKRRDAQLERKTKKLVTGMSRFFPEQPMEAAFSWAGTFGATKDGLPYIGATREYPNAYFALGYGGNGTTFSVVAAEIIRDLYLGRKNPDAQHFRFDR